MSPTRKPRPRRKKTNDDLVSFLTTLNEKQLVDLLIANAIDRDDTTVQWLGDIADEIKERRSTP